MLYHTMVSNKGMWECTATPSPRKAQLKSPLAILVIESWFLEAAVLEISDNPKKKNKDNYPFITSQAL